MAQAFDYNYRPKRWRSYVRGLFAYRGALLSVLFCRRFFVRRTFVTALFCLRSYVGALFPGALCYGPVCYGTTAGSADGWRSIDLLGYISQPSTSAQPTKYK